MNFYNHKSNSSIDIPINTFSILRIAMKYNPRCIPLVPCTWGIEGRVETLGLN
jgi:hypothetical protein